MTIDDVIESGLLESNIDMFRNKWADGREGWGIWSRAHFHDGKCTYTFGYKGYFRRQQELNTLKEIKATLQEPYLTECLAHYQKRVEGNGIVK